ncbi:MAG: poly-gamma-glutamate biosynthesis protein PgsC [Nitrospirae bacterium]|nr:poly-gamma-glutamate biosynthesis protein PgsC [Nitrospirota bacterium]MDA8339308.1 poly-gamma-glutamate biosynthesis protein PgsC [Nitrospiraceae bacterium]
MSFDVQTIRIAIAVGIAVSMLWHEKKNLSPGGVIVPGVIALYIFTKPLLILYTIIVALGTYLLVKYISNYVILFGRRRFSVVMLMSFVLVWVMEHLSGLTSNRDIEFRVIGFIIPGLIANEMERQGIPQTISALSVTTIATAIIIFFLIGKV